MLLFTVVAITKLERHQVEWICWCRDFVSNVHIAVKLGRLLGVATSGLLVDVNRLKKVNNVL